MAGLTTERLRELLNYDPETGHFFWRVNIGSRARAGARAGCQRKDGYRIVRVEGSIYLEHRLAWLYVKGQWPTKFLDHKDGNPKNNEFCNLRAADVSENGCNRSSSRVNSSGFKGVSFVKSRQLWNAHITHRGKQKNLGNFKTPEEASAAYAKAARLMHGEFARL